MRRFFILLAAFLQAAAAPAAGTQTWDLSSYADFLAGTFRNMALDRDGSMRVAPSLDTVHQSDQAVVWSIARAEDGAVYYGTGHQGAVFRVAPGGSGSLLWKAPEIEVFALAAGSDGQLYAGTSPNGKVYKVSPEGEGSEFFDPGEKYIWALAFDGAGRLVVGTGDAGKVYLVGLDGTGDAWFESGQRHVMSLALDGGGSVLAGTDPEGILYRIGDDGAAFALYDSDLPEIRSIAVSRGGAIHFAAMGGGMDLVLRSIPAQQAVGPAQASAPSAQAGVQVSVSSVTSSVTYAQPQVVYSGERSALMRLVEGRAVEKIWSSNEEQVLGMALDEGGGVLFATDREGRVYRTGPSRDLSLLSQTGRAQMTSLLRAGDGVLVGSAHGGEIFRLNSAPAAEGVYEAAPRNTEGVSQWGRLSWRGRVPQGASIEISTRSGNTYRPDASWSEWSEPLAGSEGSPVTSPAARFLQWRATLRGPARLDSVRVHYLPQNSAPVVRSVNVVPEAPSQSGGSGGSQAAGSSSNYSITVSASGSSSPPQPSVGQARAPASVRKLAVVWGAEDPDGDELRAEVSFRGEGESEWKTIRDDLPGPRFSIESDALADGRYEFRVRVDDGKANPEERALSAERVSRPVLVDRTPPLVRVLPPGADGELRFAAEDAVSEIRTAEYSVDAGKWRPVLSDDGLLDSVAEEFTLRPGSLEPGEHLVVLRVRDRAGNTALAKSLLR